MGMNGTESPSGAGGVRVHSHLEFSGLERFRAKRYLVRGFRAQGGALLGAGRSAARRENPQTSRL